MGKFDHLGQTLAERRVQPCAPQKSIPSPILKDRKVQAKKVDDETFRKSIWTLDGGKSRATGKPVVTAKSGETDWHKLGEVDHAIPRSLAPDRIYDESNALLLSKWENRMRKIPCVRAPEFKYFDYSGPANVREPQRFVWRNDDGVILKERVG